LDVPEDRTLTFPCPICGDYATIQYLENSNQIFEVKNGDLCLVPSPLTEEERKTNYEKNKKRNRDVIMGVLKMYKTGDGGADTWGPWAGKDEGESFSVHESDFENVVDMIVSQIWSL
jgi:hypothetical protein